MTKSATDVMQEIVYSAIVDALDALKSASKGVPNTLLRDINAIHANSTFSDLPKELQTAISGSVRSAFNRLLKEGYSVSQGAPTAPPRRSPPPSGSNPPPVRRGGRPPPKDPNRRPKPPRPK